MSDINWQNGAVCYANGEQWVLNEDAIYNNKPIANEGGSDFVGFESIMRRDDFQLNEIRTGDFIPASELDTEQKYNEVVEVFGLFGAEDAIGYKGFTLEFCNLLLNDESIIVAASNEARSLTRQLTYHQIIAIGKLKRMMLERESIERQSSYCRYKQVEFGESKLSKFNVETPMPEVKEPKKYKPVVSQVMVDLMERMEVGIKTYGEALRPNNGRDALQDAYEEALDLACYLKQAMIERDQADD